MNTRSLLVLAAAAIAGLRCLSAQRPVSVAEQYLFTAANAERAQRGLPELRWDSTLYRAAEGHAEEMAARASISHQYPGEAELAVRAKQAGARFSLVAENVAEAPSAIRIHDAWMNSPGHRANLLDPKVDSIGISVVRRNGQLYAVQDFDRSVARLTYDEQENTVSHMLESVISLNILAGTAEARETCSMESGYAGRRQPWFVMRFTTGDLDRLPSQLTTKLVSGRYREAAIGACAPPGGQPFSSYNIAVLLYP